MKYPECQLILGSGSPRRKDLMEEAGYAFEVVKPEVVEIEDEAIPIRELTAMNAKLKADAVADLHPDAVIIAADTLVLLGETVFGKPRDRADAKRMLSELNGCTHQVFTAVSLTRKSDGMTSAFAVATDVTFKNLSEEEMAAYHAKIEPMDKAGAYAAQDFGDLIIESFSGSMTNVIGLPMDELAAELLSGFGITPLTAAR